MVQDRSLAAMPIRHAAPRTMSEEAIIEQMLEGASTGEFRQMQVSVNGAEVDEPPYLDDGEAFLAAVLQDIRRHP